MENTNTPIRYGHESGHFAEIKSTLSILTYAELIVLSLKYKHAKADSEIGSILGICHRRVGELHRSALEKIRITGNVAIDFLEDLEA